MNKLLLTGSGPVGQRVSRAVLTAAFVACLGVVATISSIFGLAAIAVGSVAMPMVYGALAVGPGVAALGAVGTGTMDVTDNNTQLLVPSISQALHTYEPNLFPILQFVNELGYNIPREEIKNAYYHQIIERSRLPRFVQVNGAVSAGSAGQPVTITVDAKLAVVPGAVLMPLQTANATTARTAFIVTAVPSATQITIKALPPKNTDLRDDALTADTFGTVPALPDDTYMFWVGNAKSEEDAASLAIKMQAITKTNFFQTFDQVASISNHQIHTMTYGNVGSWGQAEKDLAFEFKKSQEAAIIFNALKSATADVNRNGETKQFLTMSGLFAQITSGVTLSRSGNEASLTSFLYDTHESDDGGRNKMLVGGSGVTEVIDTIVASSPGLRFERGDRVAGVTVDRIEGRKGDVGVVYHPMFDEYGYADRALVLDFDNIAQAEGVPSEIREGHDKTTGNMVDRERKQLYGSKTIFAIKAQGARSVHKAVSLVS